MSTDMQQVYDKLNFSQKIRNIFSLSSIYIKESSSSKKFYLSIVATIVAGAAQIVGAIALGDLFSSSSEALLGALLIWFFAYFIQFFSELVSSWYLVDISFNLSYYWRKKILSLLTKSKSAYEGVFTSGDLASRSTIDSDGIEVDIAGIINRIVMVVVSLCMITTGSFFILGPSAFLITLCCFVPVVIPLLNAKQVQARYEKMADSNSQCGQSVSELMDHWDEISRLKAHQYALHRTTMAIDKHEKSNVHASFISHLLDECISISSYFPLIAMVVMGLVFFSKDSLSLSVWITMLKLSYDLSNPLRTLGLEVINIQKTRGRLNRILEAANFERQHNNLNNLNYRHSSELKLSIDNLVLKPVNFPSEISWSSFKASAGEVIFMTGASGSGKSSLLRQLTGLEPRLNGTIQIESSHQVPSVYIDFKLPVPNITVQSYLSKTLKLSPEALKAKLSSLAGPFLQLVDLFDVVLNEGLKDLERIKILCHLCVSLINHHPVVILDEVLSSIDERSQAEIFDIISKYFTNKIVFIATHDLSLIKKDMRHIRIEHCRVVED